MMKIRRASSRRNLACIKTYPNTINDKIAKRCQPIVEMIGSDMAQMANNNRKKNRMVERKTEDKDPRYRVFPSVQRNNDQVRFKSNTRLIQIHKMVCVHENTHSGSHGSG